MRKISVTAAVCAAFGMTPGPAAAGAMSANNFMLPSKDVALSCAPLRYAIHCSISLRANPQYSTYCFYVAGGRSYPMKTDSRWGFYNNIVSLQLDNGERVTAQLKDLRTGAHARCVE
ncbi:MAG: hypothetical protein FJX45_11130 [Alphaproteobacteria bacterium]|nr:hypothetical protein [Alphaproteobacteria bacterium]MBM3652293.1 hypothetical protein [Alphaproteobacteria bacterium]